jgi:outer membrane lipoprotein-sorting protein
MHMRRLIGVTLITTAALLAFGQRGTDLLSNFVKTLGEGKTLSVTYTLQRIGGVSKTLNVDFAKPNKVRIDAPDQLIVADGKNVTTLDKGQNTYYTRPQTADEFAGILANEELVVWAPFFDGKVFTGAASSKDLGTKNRQGTNLRVVEANLDAKGRFVVTLYLAPDNLARQAEIVSNNPDGKDTVILNAKSVVVGGAEANFMFQAPANARQLTEEELTADKWFTNLDEALAAAKRSKRMVLLDFYTDW